MKYITKLAFLVVTVLCATTFALPLQTPADAGIPPDVEMARAARASQLAHELGCRTDPPNLCLHHGRPYCCDR